MSRKTGVSTAWREIHLNMHQLHGIGWINYTSSETMHSSFAWIGNVINSLHLFNFIDRCGVATWRCTNWSHLRPLIYIWFYFFDGVRRSPFIHRQRQLTCKRQIDREKNRKQICICFGLVECLRVFIFFFFRLSAFGIIVKCTLA